MCRTVLHLLILAAHGCLSPALCPKQQEAFRNSCYEFAAIERTFVRAQAWCEQSGGHLAFIPDEHAQSFLQRHLDPDKDAWFGAAPSASMDLEESLTAEALSPPSGPLSWLDGSRITYSNWLSSPQQGAACGHIAGKSGFKWEAVKDCSKRKRFICQLESGSSTVCAGRDPTLQCGPGQVLMIRGGFYGRRNLHYCRSTPSQAGTDAHQCGWAEVTESLSALCSGRQVCHVAEVMNSSGEPCPRLGSYLSVDYQCKDGLTLTISRAAAVFNDINISIKWLSDSSGGTVRCRLSTGDGRVVYLDGPDGLEKSVVHMYTHPSTFVVAAECTSNDVRATVQKIIAIQEPVAEIGVIRCYAGNLSFHASNCTVAYADTFQIQMQVKAGSNVTYRIQKDDMLLSSSLVLRGRFPHNITVTREQVYRLGPGCHKLTLHASNMVTTQGISTDLQVYILENAAILQTSTGRNQSLESESRITIKKHARVPRSSNSLDAKPSDVASTRDATIMLSTSKQSDLNDNSKRYQWSCKDPCKCQMNSEGLTYTISPQCLPDPYQFNKYYFSVIDRSTNVVESSLSICITFGPKTHAPGWLSLTCSQGCNPVKDNTNAVLELDCNGHTECNTIVWNIEDPSDTGWPSETQSCYQNSGYRPLILKQNGGFQFTVSYTDLAKAKALKKDLTVVIYSGDNKPIYTTYDIKTSSSTNTQSPVPTPASISTSNQERSLPTRQPVSIDATTNVQGQSTLTTKGPSGPLATNDPNQATSSQQQVSSFLTTVSGTAGGKSTLSGSLATPNSISTNSGPVTSPVGTTTKPSVTTTVSSGPLSCNISPSNGTTLDAFSISCRTSLYCSSCRYCFKTKNKFLRCSKNNQVKSVFLPLGDKSANYKVRESKMASVEDLMASVESTFTQLKDQGELSGETVGQFFSSLSSELNSPSNESTQADRQKLREKMLDLMVDVVNEAPADSPVDVQALAGGLADMVQKGSELSSSAQEQASQLFVNLSSSLLHMDFNHSEENKNEVNGAASTIVEGASNILDYSSNKNVTDAIIQALHNIQSALLIFQDANKEPTTIQQDNIAVFVRRVNPGRKLSEPISIPNCSCSAFTLPTLPSSLFPSQDPVDIRMLSLKKNPFSWNGRGSISGPIGGLTLTTTDSYRIPVENLNEDIEILLPKPVGEQANVSVLDLGNYSTTAIDVSSANDTLLLKMVPSKDPLPFKLFLGYMSYPSDSNYVAMTEMPHKGSSQAERYTWLLDPKILKGNTGTYYLVVRPIVGPGIKSINANLSITSITASCKFWNESASDWTTYGCRVGVNTTHLITQCLCNHLTFFGSSFFVTPNLIDPSRTAELFATFAENPVVVCFVGALFVAYLLAVVCARRKDIKDKDKVKLSVLDDNNPMDEYRYLLTVCTGHRRGASTSAQVTITLLGTEANSEPHHLTDRKKRLFERGAVDMFLLTTPFSLGSLNAIRLWHDNSGRHPAWFVGNVMVQDLQTDQKWYFLCNSWLAIDIGAGCLDKVFPVSTEMDLKRFRNLFFMKATKDFNDGHLWYSVISRPAGSSFTCVQRVSCCFSLLLCTMLTSIMFYGVPADPSEQVMEMGGFEFTWQQFMIGIESSLIMFPVNFLIVTIFRLTRPREISCCKSKARKAAAPGLQRASRAATTGVNASVTLDHIIKDITRVTQLLSENAKSNIPRQLGPGQQVDIRDVLTVVEDFITQNNKTGDRSPSRIKSVSSVAQSQTPGSGGDAYPGSTVGGIERKSNKSQYLYRQLCHVQEELSLLGPSGFPTPHSYSQALQQVRRMKAFLEDQLFTSSGVGLHEATQNKLTPKDGGDSAQKRCACCQAGLPWWFVFVGWLLVIASSVVAGFFTMLYGLKFGKPRSVNWLVSMIVSFLQSILVIQPVKVLCLAVFFALVIKKVDEEDLQQNVSNLGNDKPEGNFSEQPAVRQTRNVYEPPPLADVEKMKKNKMMEQKAFALFKEILTYMLFMAMLLLVAYAQRDPNAFYLNRHITDSFSGKISGCVSLKDVYAWANTSLLANLFPGDYPGFITDGNSRLMGSARLRQVRVKPNSCRTPGPMLQLVSDCNALYSWEAEDMGSYGLGWNHSVGTNVSGRALSPWVYQTQAELRANSVWGTLALYRAGGFVAELGPDLQTAQRTLDYLSDQKWLDAYTRAIFVEFSVYNANVNLFCIVTLLLETPALGAFKFSSELHSVRLHQPSDGLYICTVAAEVIYLLFILYYMFLQGKLMKQQRWAYFRSKWNLLELAIISLSWSAVGLFIKMTVLGRRDMTHYLGHKNHFASFYDTASSESQLQYLIAFLVLLSSVKLWHLLRLNPKMYMITATLRRAWNDISSFLVVIVVMFLAYSTSSNVIYGWKLSSYKTLDKTFLTLVGMQIGIFNYDEVFDYTPVLGGLLFGSCIVLMTFMVLNLLVSVILVAFQHERIYHKPSEEEEIVDLMLKKICNFFGIRYRDSENSPEPGVKSGGDLIFNNGKNNINASVDVNRHQAPEDPVKPQET